MYEYMQAFIYVGMYEVRTYVFICENTYLYIGTDAF